MQHDFVAGITKSLKYIYENKWGRMNNSDILQPTKVKDSYSLHMHNIKSSVISGEVKMFLFTVDCII